jgi:hypothetical protein
MCITPTGLQMEGMDIFSSWERLPGYDPNPGIGKNAIGFEEIDGTAKHSAKVSKKGKYVHYRKTR